MRKRASVVVGSIVVLGLLCTVSPPEMRAQDGPGGQPAEEVRDQVDEARLNVELLGLELAAEKSQLKQQLQLTKMVEFGAGGMGGGMGGFGGGAADTEEGKKEREKLVASSRERLQALKAATLETTRRLGRERRRLAELEGRLNAERPGGVAKPGAAPAAIVEAEGGGAKPPGIEERLAEIERKLDRLVKKLDAPKP